MEKLDIQRYDHDELGVQTGGSAHVDRAGNKCCKGPHTKDHRPLQEVYKKLWGDGTLVFRQ